MSRGRDISGECIVSSKRVMSSERVMSIERVMSRGRAVNSGRAVGGEVVRIGEIVSGECLHYSVKKKWRCRRWTMMFFASIYACGF